jgi:FkbM family methyltransferase
MTAGDFERSSVSQCAMGSQPGKATLYTNEEGSPLGSLYPHQEAGWIDLMKHVRLSEELVVSVDTVDRFIARSEIPSVDILKIDTEGHEMEVMLGAEEAIAADRVDLITFEFGVHQVESRHFFKDYWLHLTQRNYSLYFVTDAGDVTPIERYEYRWEQFNRNVEYIASRLPLQSAARDLRAATKSATAL